MSHHWNCNLTFAKHSSAPFCPVNSSGEKKSTEDSVASKTMTIEINCYYENFFNERNSGLEIMNLVNWKKESEAQLSFNPLSLKLSGEPSTTQIRELPCYHQGKNNLTK